MYVAMNRFWVNPGKGPEFEEVWRKRESYLKEVEGFVAFHFLRGPEEEYISHTLWESEEAFQNWIGSEAFHKAHAQAGQMSKDFLKESKLAYYDVLLSERK